jgi:hypothetical protein
MDMNKVNVSTNLMASTAVNGLRNTGSKGENKVEPESKLEDKLQSKITKDGILLKFKDKEKLIKIEGDDNDIKKYLKTGNVLGLTMGVFSSVFEGALKGLGVAFLSVLYPVVYALYKYMDSYREVKEEANEMGAKNENEIKKAALKGGIWGGVKGLGNGILDLAIVGSLAAAGFSLMGTPGFVLAPFVGAAYNLVKDEIRLRLSEPKGSKVS